ncbi:GDSL esterase/lipase At5g03610 isoform X1 [Arachis duranensis]|uniref:GDSL esterase/lipase At5g03610 isoform X1 n=1 Tax=Arachis duranensis TaxID=130453 RepID=A0A6P4CIB8_ARADU|nr:GDSL esterase/lipase At5g03610 isoform X1 [Arachis duranensis]
MELPKQLFFFFLTLIFLSGHIGLQAEARVRHYGPTKLFVFGDSYVDAGNTRKDQPGSWKQPYGITFPGKPAGRFSDGRVFSDYIAKYLGLKSPVPYNLRKMMPNNLKYGMNFAYGGTGVFNTTSKNPNMTIQIDFFEKLIKENVYTASDLSNSIAYVSVAGNDYNYYLTINGSIQGFPSYIASVINQTTKDLIRIKNLGVKKVAIGGLQPLGCLPLITSTSSFQKCNETFNNLVAIHNNLLNQSITKLKQSYKGGFLIIDLFDSFTSVLNHPKTYNLHNELIPCCLGTSQGFTCGDVDNNNVKKYKVCENPKTAFFWDLFHPTQAGWHAVYNKLQNMNALSQLRN